MEYTKQSEIAEAGVRQFEGVIPTSWIFRRQSQEDIGIDGELEITKKGLSTANIMKVQIKSTKDPQYTKNNSLINLSLKIDNAVYYCDDLKIPIIIIVADLKNRKTYWQFPQLNIELKRKLQEAQRLQQETISISISIKNLLPDTVEEIEHNFNSSIVFLSTKTIIQTDPFVFVQELDEKIDLKTIQKDFQNKIDVIEIESIKRLIINSEYGDASRKIDDIISNPCSSIQLKFSAHIEEERISTFKTKQKLISINDDIKNRIAIAKKLKELTQKGPMHLKYFATLLYKTAQLYGLSHKDYRLFIYWQVYTENRHSLSLDFYYQRRLNTEALMNKYRQCLWLLKKCYEVQVYYILPECTYRLIEAMTFFYQRLKKENLEEAANYYREKLHNITRIACDFAVTYNNWDALFALSLGYLWLANSDDLVDVNSSCNLARIQINRIIDVNLKSYYNEKFNNIKDILCQSTNPISSVEGVELDKQIYVSMANELGINLDDQTDATAQVVSLGINDYNPERILKNCQHLFVAVSKTSEIGQILMLPTAGLKYLHCTLKNCGITGMSLDMIFDAFKHKYCHLCTDKKPHPVDWRWTHEWQQKEDRKHQILITYLRTGNPK